MQLTAATVTHPIQVRGPTPCLRPDTLFNAFRFAEASEITHGPVAALSGATLLDRLAWVVVHVGLGGLPPGQQLVITAPRRLLALTRRP
jgi:hypothetical protein